MKRISEEKMIKWSVQQNYKCWFQLVSKLKTNKLLKLLLVDIKANSSILIGNGRDGTKQAKMPYFHFGTSS